jgi:hypothetical protein
MVCALLNGFQRCLDNVILKQPLLEGNCVQPTNSKTYFGHERVINAHIATQWPKPALPRKPPAGLPRMRACRAGITELPRH